MRPASCGAGGRAREPHADRHPHAGPDAGPDAGRGADRTGAFIPGAPSDPSRIDAFAALAGAMPRIVIWYQGWGGEWNAFYARGADAVHARGAMQLITWEPWADSSTSEWSLTVIARGDHDAYIRSWAADVAAWGRLLYVRPMHEMNGSWHPWGMGVLGNTHSLFRTAWRHVVDLVRVQGASSISWVWCPNTLLPNGVTCASLYRRRLRRLAVRGRLQLGDDGRRRVRHRRWRGGRTEAPAGRPGRHATQR